MSKQNNNIFDEFFESFMEEYDTQRNPKKYPPANVSLYNDIHDNNCAEIILALPGFEKNELTVIKESGRVIVRGSPKHTYLYKKTYINEIVMNKFEREFDIAGEFEISSAEFKNGLLIIHLYFKPPNETGSFVEIT